MNLAASRICFHLTNVSNVGYFARGTRLHLLKLPRNVNSTTLRRTKATKPNLFGVNQAPNRLAREEVIGPFGFFLLSIPIAAFGLGTWQVERRKWKLNLIADLQSRINADPVDLPEDLYELETMEYHPVKVRGRFLHDKELVVGPRSLIMDGAAAGEGGSGLITSRPNTGYIVITPFKLTDRDLTILVNRGWVPATQKNPSQRLSGQVEGELEITGLVRLNEKRPPFIPQNRPANGSWYYRDLNAMAEVAETAPVLIDLTAKHSLPDGPIGGQTRVTLRNEHLSYIFTWYTLSAITSMMWYRQFILKLPLL